MRAGSWPARAGGSCHHHHPGSVVNSTAVQTLTRGLQLVAPCSSHLACRSSRSVARKPACMASPQDTVVPTAGIHEASTDKAFEPPTRHAATGFTAEQQNSVLTEGRDWQAVRDFWHAAVSGRVSVSDLHPSLPAPEQYMADLQLYHNAADPTVAGPQPAPHQQQQPTASSSEAVSVTTPVPRRSGKQDRLTYKVAIAYYGPAFCGWARQPGDAAASPTVEALLSAALAPMAGDKTNVAVASAGRTDKGVHAVGQVFSFYSWKPLLSAHDIARAVHSAADKIAPHSVRVIATAVKPRAFHAQFAASWRRYLYLLPLRTTPATPSADPLPSISTDTTHGHPFAGDVDAEVVHQLLQPLVGQPLDFQAYARDTPKGKATTCVLHVARAMRVQLPIMDTADASSTYQAPVGALCVELVGDRFLRRMVRVLVSTVVMEALAVQAARACRPSGNASSETSSFDVPVLGGEHNSASSAWHSNSAEHGCGGDLQRSTGRTAGAATHGAPGSVGSASSETLVSAVDSTPADNVSDADVGMLLAMQGHCGPVASRRDTCVAAPAEGLCLAGVGYDETAWHVHA